MSEPVSSPRRNNALQNSAFICQIASYVGLVPEEKSGGDRRRQGDISKQGNLLLRFLLVEAAQVTVLSHL